jgi:hypothetical protein
VTPQDIGIFILVFVALIPAVEAIRKWFGKGEARQITPQPLEVRASPEYMTAENCTAKHREHEQHLDQRFKAMSAEFRAILQEELRRVEDTHTTRTENLRKEIGDKIGGVHRRVDQILRYASQGVHEE